MALLNAAAAGLAVLMGGPGTGLPVGFTAFPDTGSSYLCTVDVVARVTHCTRSTGSDGVRTAPLEMVVDAESYGSADETYRMRVRFTNSTESTIGIPDRETVVGFRVTVGQAYPVPEECGGRDRPAAQEQAPSGNCIVLLNPDARYRFRDDRPYFRYVETVPPGGSSSAREWLWQVPPSAAHFSFTVHAWARAAGEVEIPARAPVGWVLPRDWIDPLLVHGNLIYNHPRMNGRYPRNIVALLFTPDAPVQARQAALDLVDGTLLGGSGVHHYVHVPVLGEEAPVWWAHDLLRPLPQVERVSPFHMSSVSH
jgi:hypothetical protein